MANHTHLCVTIFCLVIPFGFQVLSGRILQDSYVVFSPRDKPLFFQGTHALGRKKSPAQHTFWLMMKCNSTYIVPIQLLFYVVKFVNIACTTSRDV